MMDEARCQCLGHLRVFFQSFESLVEGDGELPRNAEFFLLLLRELRRITCLVLAGE